MITKEQFLKRATAKNIKQMRGHDAPSYEWDIYFDNKKICNCWDDSYGGGLQITNYDNQSIEDIYNSIDKDTLWDKQSKWTTSLEILMEDLLNIAYEKKDRQKLFRKGILYETDNGSFEKDGKYGLISWKNWSIPKLTKNAKGKDLVQNTIEKTINEKKQIINKEYLMSLDYTF